MAYRLDKLNTRRSIKSSTSDSVALESARVANESYNNIYESETVKYIVGSMQSIPDSYTRKSYEEADRVKNQLLNQLTHPCEFDYQGSVTNDTHIKFHSDIDLLLLTKKFLQLENPQKAPYLYIGNALQDLKELRNQAILVLKSTFHAAEIDVTGSKCISIQGGSLSRKIDVVPCNWFNTNSYKNTNDKTYRGVQVYDSKNNIQILNTPFLHNSKIAQKDSLTNGGMRKATRLLKSIKADSDKVSMSSFDIASIVYNIPDQLLTYTRHKDLRVFSAVLIYVSQLINNVFLRDSLLVPDGHRKIFAHGHANLQDLHFLLNELYVIKNELLIENRAKFSDINEAVLSGYYG